jgi:hypothetical protein
VKRALATTLALGMALLGGSLARSQPSPATAGIDLRILASGRVLARRGAHASRGGDAVRVVSGATSCDGTLGPDVQTQVTDEEGDSASALAAEVRGCTVTSPLFAILRPPPLVRWPVRLTSSEPRAAAAIALAQAAAATAGHLRGTIAWEPARVYTLGDALYVLVSGPACTEEESETGCSPSVAALARVRAGGEPEVILARPAHWLWTHEELIDCWFGWQGITDVDGDGVVEIVETQIGESAFMIRLVRPGARPAGDVVWLASYRDDPLDATVGRPPRPVPH